MPVQGRVALGAPRGRRSAGSAVGFAPATMGTLGFTSSTLTQVRWYPTHGYEHDQLAQ
jgi:hypothetical protein